MVSIKWCKQKKNGIKLIEPNDNLFHEYIEIAEETLDVLRAIKGKSKAWQATTKYYCEYFAFYALLMKIGIKCEIHECTISLCWLLERLNVIPKGYSKTLEDDKQLRIDNQYYLKNRAVSFDYDELLNFVLTMKNIGLRLTNEDILNIQREIFQP